MFYFMKFNAYLRRFEFKSFFGLSEYNLCGMNILSSTTYIKRFYKFIKIEFKILKLLD